MNSPLSLAFQTLLKHPGFTTVAVLTLACCWRAWRAARVGPAEALRGD